MVLLPLVVWIGSFFGPSDFSRKSYFKESVEIEEAILDYVEGVYEADPGRIKNSVHPAMIKRGRCFEKNRKFDPAEVMTFEHLLDLTGQWNKKEYQADAPLEKRIVIYDVHDRTATAGLTAVWGKEFIHLAKIDGKWFIINVLRQPRR